MLPHKKYYVITHIHLRAQVNENIGVDMFLCSCVIAIRFHRKYKRIKGIIGFGRQCNMLNHKALMLNFFYS